jgi:hypothetical protein
LSCARAGTTSRALANRAASNDFGCTVVLPCPEECQPGTAVVRVASRLLKRNRWKRGLGPFGARESCALLVA